MAEKAKARGEPTHQGKSDLKQRKRLRFCDRTIEAIPKLFEYLMEEPHKNKNVDPERGIFHKTRFAA